MILRFFYLSSLNVALATGACAAAFFKLPGGKSIENWISLIQIVLVCWLIYILDRLLDVIRAEKPIDTTRHQYHLTHQYNLQVLAISLAVISAALLFFQPLNVTIYGAILGVIVILYLAVIVPKQPQSKDFFMPLIYTLAVVGVPYVVSSSVNFSSWLVAGLFLIVVYQNLFTFSHFESNNNKKRKSVNYLAGLSIFIFIVFFSNGWEYVNKLALIFTVISVAYSFICSNNQKFENSYRWLMDSLLFFPLLVVFF